MNVTFFSSVRGAAFMESLLDEWRRLGRAADICHVLDSRNGRSPSGPFGTFARRWQMYIGIAWKSWRTVRSARGDGGPHVATTNPFYLPALVQRVSRGNGATIQLLYDLYPDALIAAGLCRPGSPVVRACASITRYALRECAITVFLGERLRAHAEASYGPARRAAIIPVGADGTPFRGHEPVALVAGAKPVILYCGQMGRMHEVDTILAVLPTEVARHYTWCFHAGGNGYARLREQAGPLPDVVFGGHLQDTEWRAAMLSASIALVTIMRGGEKVVMPSKTYSAMVAGQAILAVCVRESDLADMVLDHDCGWVVEPGDTAGLVALLERLTGHHEEVLTKRRNAYRAGHGLYDMVPVAKHWLDLFHQLETK